MSYTSYSVLTELEKLSSRSLFSSNAAFGFLFVVSGLTVSFTSSVNPIMRRIVSLFLTSLLDLPVLVKNSCLFHSLLILTDTVVVKT